MDKLAIAQADKLETDKAESTDHHHVRLGMNRLITGDFLQTIIDTLQARDYGNVGPEGSIYQGYGEIDWEEAGGLPAGVGCGVYVSEQQKPNLPCV